MYRYSPGMTLSSKSSLQLQVRDVDLMVLTGIYSEETHLPQLLRVSVLADLEAPDHFGPDAKLTDSKNYMDLKEAILETCPQGQHYVLVEAVADAIIDRLFDDSRVTCASVTIVKTALTEKNETIGIERTRRR
ncbi:dihydroneopterin aldolase [Pacificimonas sp. ICDLI1SI03]